MSDLPLDREFEPQYGNAVSLSPLVQRLTCRNPSAFTFRGTSSYIVGGENVAVIDPGPDDEAHFDALVAALDGRTVTHILITHTHRDHSPLAARLKDLTGAKTYAYGPHGSGRKTGWTVEGTQLDAGGDMDFVPDVNLDQGDVIEGTAWTLESVFTPGHCSNHVAFALKEEDTLFSGDHVMAWSTSVIAPPDGNMADYLNSLNLLFGRNEHTYLPGHGPAKHDPLPFVRAFMTHRRMREEAIYRLIRLGDRNIMDIVPKVYAGVDERLHPAAAMSTLAHVEHLLEQGKIVAREGAGLTGIYEAR
jgi:glyoxylase-like metal-dependent hydrolase (beta-lactamase superfamily II)